VRRMWVHALDTTVGRAAPRELVCETPARQLDRRSGGVRACAGLHRRGERPARLSLHPGLGLTGVRKAGLARWGE
jgi:hypothetical protein